MNDTNDDKEKYDQLLALWGPLAHQCWLEAHKDQEHLLLHIWSEIESIKNRNGGYVPGTEPKTDMPK